MERTGQLRLIWASKRWLLLFAVVAAVVVYGVSSLAEDKYEAEALGQIVSTSQSAGEILNEEQLLSLSNLYQQLASTQTVLDLAHRDPAVQGREAEFDEAVSAQPEARVGVLAFNAETGNARDAAAFANAYATAFSTYLDDLQVNQREQTLSPIQSRIDEVAREIDQSGAAADDPSIAGLQTELQALQDRAAEETANPGDTMRVIERAVPPTAPFAPTPRRDALLAFIGALLLGAAAIYLRDLIFDRYGSPEETARDLNLPILAEIPKARGDVPVLEPFRSLRTAVTLALERSNGAGARRRVHDGARSLLVTGAESGCGKSYVASNLARALATEGRRVMAVDADLRRPTLQNQFDIRLAPGLSDVLVGDDPARPSDLSIKVELPGAAGTAGSLHVLPAGSHVEDSVEWLSSERMGTIVDQLHEDNDVLLFDSPPTLVVVDPVVMARYVDGVVFVIDSRRSRRRDVRRAVQALRAIGAPLVGFVFNRSSTTPAAYDSYEPSRELRATRLPKETKV